MESPEKTSGWNSLPLSTKIKYISIIILAVLFTIFITQNLEEVQLDVFFWSFNVRFVFALILCFFMGVIITYSWMKIKHSNKKKSKTLESTVND